MNNTGKGFAVIELFTSEGCSSCPPADRLIEQLGAQDQQGQLYILAYHVDYWDHQGWKDRFSDKSYTARQQEYARLLHVDPIYTPQLVVNGAGEFVGSDQRSISAAIGEQLQQDLPRKLKLNGVIDGKNLIISHNGEQNTKSELVVALVQKKAESRVKAGENMGRDLSHVQIVRDLKQVSLQNGSTAEIRLPKDFDKSSWEVIGFVQDKESGKITDATRFGW
ncbi:DUF1223 domain-containing protein [Paraflavitalea sp. CAU 1676]|uniref:DUF1223 domain-containing protein n=1 Tax=Paraflavitalea sp. CAU 1676 TaxID=3032598 RepID=UPI0023DCBC91|nr:DUF1223 domain-containing protein [Paraflavitalea sp. CAU 1676]MDF2189858.1 DUF1223 domain-containing protein [Paraflavitalea sp. CAU 1676]